MIRGPLRGLGALGALWLVATLSACSLSTSPSRDHGTHAHPQPTQTAELTVSPLPLGHVGAPADYRPGTATFSPPNPGAPVELQVLRGGVWHTLVKGSQD